MLIEETSAASSSGPKLGERLPWMGTPSMTNWVWYSEPRGCSTALPSYSQPGWELMSACSERPGSALSRLWSVIEPMRATAPACSGLINVLGAVTVTACDESASLSCTATWVGVEVRMSTACTHGANPAWVMVTAYTP